MIRVACSESKLASRNARYYNDEITCTEIFNQLINHNRGLSIEIGGLECAVGHVERNANGESKW